MHASVLLNQLVLKITIAAVTFVILRDYLPYLPIVLSYNLHMLHILYFNCIYIIIKKNQERFIAPRFGVIATPLSRD